MECVDACHTKEASLSQSNTATPKERTSVASEGHTAEEVPELLWTCPDTTDTRTLRIIGPPKEVLGARGNATVSAGVQAGGRPAGALFG